MNFSNILVKNILNLWIITLIPLIRFLSGNVIENGVEKMTLVKLNENISVIDNPKIFQLNWINDKRIIDRSNRNHIYTKPITLA